MKTEKLNYPLPTELIAQQPCDVRSASRLLVFNRANSELTDSRFSRIADFLQAGDCLVLNDTKVVPARFFAHRGSGGKLEGLFLAENHPGIWEVMLKGASRVKAGQAIYLEDKAQDQFCEAIVLEKLNQGRWRLKIQTETDSDTVLERIGFAPLPPYIKRDRDLNQAAVDTSRYQTIYARKAGAVAAPTAGLHFTEELIEQLKAAQVQFAYVTLHVGPGTFKPVSTANLDEHQIHTERYRIDAENARIINSAKQQGRRVIAVGTTSARVLETVAERSAVTAGSGTTNLFIKPGYEFKIIDALVTNFHLPKSTLLALVATFAGLENILMAYSHAVEQRYRFYSYGDSMLII